MRDHWNNVAVTDEEKLIADCIAIVNKAGELNYSEMQELRISSELCDRGHFAAAFDRIAAKAGEKAPKELAYILEDSDFDVRVSFMKAVVEAVDPLPAGVRAKRG